MTAPSRLSRTKLSRWPEWSGVSRIATSSVRRSLSTTSAARLIRSPVLPIATLDIVLIEQGAMIMPFEWKEPDEIDAPILPTSCTSWPAR